MVIRGGFGWAYNRNLISDAVTAFNNGLTQTVDYLQTSLGTLASSSTLQRISPGNYAARDASTRKAPTVYDYSISVQHELAFQMVLEVAYVGNLQRHQPINFNLNAIPPGTAFLPQYVDSTNAGYNFAGPITASNPGPPLLGSNAENAIVMRPYLGLGTLTATANVGNNRYDSLQASVNKRFGSGLMFQAAYTNGRLISGQENVGIYSYNWKQYAGYVSQYNRQQTLAMNYIYDLPKWAAKLGSNHAAGAVLEGWQFAHLLAFFSGLPYSPQFSIQQANTGSTINLQQVFMGTPDITPRLAINGSLSPTASRLYFNPSKLGVPAIFPSANGTGSRNFLTAPGTFANDMSLTKRFRIAEGKSLEFRVNAYNVFNQVRRVSLNTSVQYKANGADDASGFAVYNLPDQLAQRTVAAGITNPTAVYNQYRSGVGYANLTTTQAMRIVELGVKLRF